MNCTHCSAPTELALCDRCDQTLRVALDTVAAYYRDCLRIEPGSARARVQSAYHSAPPPISATRVDAISRAILAVDNSISGWCRILINDIPDIESVPPHSTPKAVEWLASHRASIRTLPWAGELLRDALACEQTLRRVLDQAGSGWYAGTCGNPLGGERIHDGASCACACHQSGMVCDLDCHPDDVVIAQTCDRPLYVVPGSRWVTCPGCGRAWAADERRAAVIAEVRDRVAPASVAAQLIVGWLDTEPSVERVVDRIRKWAERGRLVRATTQVHDGKTVPAYRIGDVLDLLATPTPTPPVAPVTASVLASSVTDSGGFTAPESRQHG